MGDAENTDPDLINPATAPDPGPQPQAGDITDTPTDQTTVDPKVESGEAFRDWVQEDMRWKEQHGG